MQTYYFFTYYRDYIRSWSYETLEDCISDALENYVENKEDVAVYSFDVDDDICEFDIEDLKDSLPLYRCKNIITINEKTYNKAVKMLK